MSDTTREAMCPVCGGTGELHDAPCPGCDGAKALPVLDLDLLRPAAPTRGADAPSEEVEAVSALVHEAWMESKRAAGVTSRKSESGEELMVPYAELSEQAKDLDRVTVRTVLKARSALAESAPCEAPDAPRPTDSEAATPDCLCQRCEEARHTLSTHSAHRCTEKEIRGEAATPDATLKLLVEAAIPLEVLHADDSRWLSSSMRRTIAEVVGKIRAHVHARAGSVDRAPSPATVEITVNGVAHAVPAEVPLSNDDIERLVGGGVQGLTVKYTHRDSRSGLLVTGRTVVPTEGMRLTAVHTGNA